MEASLREHPSRPGISWWSRGYPRRVTDCPSCGAENPDGARFCATCGSALAAACATCGATLTEGARFCAACGTPVVPEVPAGEERKLVTILFADVTGSTQLGEQLDPERLR